MDLDPSGVCYGASIQIIKSLDPRTDVLLAYKINDEHITLDHGYPVGLIVPGVLGARSVKWVNRIIFLKSESPSHFQQNHYKVFSPSIDYNNVDLKKLQIFKRYQLHLQFVFFKYVIKFKFPKMEQFLSKLGMNKLCLH